MQWHDDSPTRTLADLAGDGYVRWELRRRPSEGDDAPRRPPEGDDAPLFFHPVFIEMDRANIGALLERAGAEAPDLLLEGRERLLLEMERDSEGPERVRAVIYLRSDRLDEGALFTILQVAPSLSFKQPPQSREADTHLKPILGERKTGPAIFGVIDDCAPFLNARFRRTETETRFLAVWLQQLEDFDEKPDSRAPKRLFAGPVIDREDIESMIGQGPEPHVYSNFIADGDIALATGRALTRAAAHGAHVLDLCCGADFEGPRADADMVETDILAVQLPGEAVGQTDGRRLQGYVMQGLRWIVDRAIDANLESDTKRPLIVNVSLGVTAGPKRGGSFVETWAAYELQRFRDATKVEARLVLSYGNAHRSAQIAYRKLGTGEKTVIEWRIQPDDRTASHLELRSSGTIKVVLSPPHGAPAVAFDLPLAVPWALRDGGKLVALVQTREGAAGGGGAERDRDILLSVAPTRSSDGAATAPAGAWWIAIENTAASCVEVSLQVQRDDHLPGTGFGGRQSYLDHPCAWGWDAETRDRTAPDGSPITREGTHSADATSTDPRILSVGAARFGLAQGVRPTLSTAAGASATTRFVSISEGPTVSALTVERDARNLPGRRGTGVLSGSTARYGGTSAAAPQVARALARVDLAALNDVELLAPEPVHQTSLRRLGARVVDPEKTRDSRTDDALRR